MKLLIFRVGERDCALDGSRVRRVRGPGEVEAPPCYDLADLFPDSEARWDTLVLLEVQGRPVALRVPAPEGFREIEASALLPLPPFLFREGKRPIRAVFLDSGRACLLLDERELARRASTACS